MLTMVVGNVWATAQYEWVQRFNGTTTFDNDDLKKITDGEYTNNVKFSISGVSYYSGWGNKWLEYPQLKKKTSNSDSKFTWSVEDDTYRVKVTKIIAAVRGYGAANSYAYFNSEAAKKCGTLNTGEGGSTDISIENSNGLTSPVTFTRDNRGVVESTFTLHNIRYTYKVEQRVPKFQYKAIAIASPNGGGNVYASFTANSFSSATATTTSYSGDVLSTSTGMTKTAYFKAEAKTGYNFVGWATSPNATTYLSTNLTYSQDLTSYSNDDATPTTLTLYAIFKAKNDPIFTGNNISNLRVGHTQTADYVFTHTATTKPSADSNADFYFTIVHTPDATSKQGSPDASKVVSYNPETNEITALNSGSATITFTHKETDNYYKKTASYTISVIKNTTSFKWNDTNLFWDNERENYFQTTHTATPISIDNQTDTEVALLHFNPNDKNDKHTLDLTTFNKEGHTTKVTVTQAENYYWKKHTEEHEIKPQDPSNHVTFTIDSDEKMTKIFKHSSNNEDDLTWDNGIRLGDDDWVLGPGEGNKDGGYDWSDKYIIIKFTGIPDSLFLTTDTDDAATTGTGSDLYFSISEGYIPQGTEEITFTKTWEYTKQNNDIALKLDPQTRCIKLCYTGNLRGWFKGTDKYSGVTVTELDKFYAVETNTDAEKTEIEHLNFGHNQVTIDTTLYFDIKYANAGYKVKAVSNDSHFTVRPENTSDMGGEKMGVQTFAVTYTSNDPYATTDNNSYITITDELEHIKGHKDIVYLHASSDRAEQRLAWRDDFAAVNTPVVRISHDTIQHAAHSSSKLEITYTSSDPTVIQVIEEGTVLKLLKPGEATITATQKGNNLFKPADQIEKTFIVTDKLLQFIIWTDAPTNIVKSGDNQTIALNALVHVQTDNGEIVYSEERTNMLTYTSGNPNIVSVTDNTLHVNAIGKTTLTASVVGDEDYAEASLTVPVIVRSETAGCPDPLLYELEEPIQFFQGDLFEIVKNPIPLNTDVGIPGYVIVEHTGNEWRLPIIGTTFYEAAIRVEEKTASNSNWTTKGTIYPQKGQVMLDTIAISRDATEIRFVRNEGGQGYQFLNKIEVHPAQYIEAVDEIDFGTILVGSKETRTFDVNYSNIKDVLSPTPSSKDVVVAPKEFGACGTFGTQLITVDWTPSKVSPENGFTIETITFFDSNSNREKVVTLKAFVQKGPQSIFWDDWDGEKPEIISLCNLMPFPEKTTADLPITWTLISGNEYANFIDGTNILELYQNGTITVQASSEASENYLAYSEEFTFVLEVTPIFLGTVDSSWENVENWNFKRLPCEVEVAFIQAPATLSSPATVQGITFAEGEQKVSLHITPTGGLTVNANGITNAAEDGSSIVIDNTREGAGFLRISPDYQGTMPYFTMRYQTKSTLDNGANKDATWQYIGAPGANCQFTVDYITWLYQWSEPKNWLQQSGTLTLSPFAGYAITQYGQPTYELTAEAITADRTITLTKTPSGMNGDNLFANSYMAPIDAKNFTPEDFSDYGTGREDIEKTFYVFNSGSWNEWNKYNSLGQTIGSNGSTTPGQYCAIPALSSKYLNNTYDITTIPPMQGVYVIAKNENAAIYLNYQKHVWRAGSTADLSTDMHEPMRAPSHNAYKPDNFRRLRIQINSSNSGADRMYVIQDTITTPDYDNGYDAPNQLAEGLANIYTNEHFGQMEISCSNHIDSTFIGFTAGVDSIYTLTFNAIIGNDLHLHDLENDSIILLEEGTTYTFHTTPNSKNDLRFQILIHPEKQLDFEEIEKDEIITGVADVHTTQVWSHGSCIYINNAPANTTATLFNISGNQLLTTPIHHTPYTLDLSYLSKGVYLLQLNSNVYKFIIQ